MTYFTVTIRISAHSARLSTPTISSRAKPSEVLKDAGRGNSGRLVGRFNRALVVAQIVVTCVLLIGSMLQLKSILRQQEIDHGYDTESVLTARMGLMEGDYPDSARRQIFYEHALRELRANPQYADAALSSRFRMLFTGAAPIFQAVMLAAHKRVAESDDTLAIAGPGLEQREICSLSGAAANAWCPVRRREWLPVEDATVPCSWHHLS